MPGPKARASDLRDILRRYWPVVLGAVVLVPHAAYFDFVNDDAYISFRYARNLALHGELTFNLGERVEGFTNFLWTVLLALFIKLGVSPVASARFFGVAFAVGTLAVAVRMSLRLDRERPSPWHAVAPLLLAFSSAFACWCTGGLETQMFTFLVFFALERMLAEIEHGQGFASAALFAAAAMTRPEGALLFATGAAFRAARAIVTDRRLLPRRHELAWVGLFLGLFVPFFVGRWAYYGWPFPNTFYVKSSGSAGAWQLGLYYLRRFAEDHFLVFLFPLVLLGRPARDAPRRRALYALALLVWTVFALYTAKVGGDFMGLYRFVLPVLPVGAMCLQESLRHLWARLTPVVGRVVVAMCTAGVLAGYVAGNAHLSHIAAVLFVAAENRTIDSPAYLKKYAVERMPIGLWLRQHAQPDDVVAVGGAGVIPYYSDIRAYDVYGLVDDKIAHDPATTQDIRPGHQKWGAGHLLARRPTLVMFQYCLGGPCGFEDSVPFPGYEWVRATIPGAQLPYYSFLKRTDRAFGPFPARISP